MRGSNMECVGIAFIKMIIIGCMKDQLNNCSALIAAYMALLDLAKPQHVHITEEICFPSSYTVFSAFITAVFRVVLMKRLKSELVETSRPQFVLLMLRGC